MNAMDIAVGIFLALGCFFALTGAVGIVRMPDFFSRLHPAGKNDTLAVTSIMIALLIRTVEYDYHWTVATKLLLIVGIIFVTAPAASHAISKAAFLDGLKPWTKPGDTEASNE
ncbi:MAG: monovalent cation/H(+) antiporter subunit G [Candidatus Poribacteria bacterium]|nr:monovalent cation/H(+) antiporter subunit G [Candidatus Poribacteria bacterium]